MHRQQLTHFIRQPLVDWEAHQHPPDHQRCLYGHHDKLVGLAVDDGHVAALRLLGHGQQRQGQRSLEIANLFGHTDSAYRKTGVQQGCYGGTDAAAMIFQNRLYGFLVV